MSIAFNYLCPKCGKLTLITGAGACQNKFNSGAVCGYQLPRELSDFNSHVRGKIEKHTVPPTGPLPNLSSKIYYNPSTGFYLENLDAACSAGILYLDPANGYFCTYITPSGCTTIATLCSGNANQFTISGYKLPLNSKLQNLHGHYDNLDAEMIYVAVPGNVVVEEPSAAHPHEFRVIQNGKPIAAWNTQAQSGFVGSHIVINDMSSQPDTADQLPASSPYEMTVDLNVLDHLGINLYSNIAAVLTEVVANAWDADADKVQIRVDADSKWIEIEDDGIGMTVADMNEKYLRVGYRRRERGGEHGKVTAKGRPVMGRKGLGKLSLFSIAGIIEVQSAKDGEAHGLRMTAAGIQQSVRDQESSYRPEKLAVEKVTRTKGTLIRLEDIKRQRLTGGVAAMKKRLARRFSVLGQAHGFEITIDGQGITAAERGDLPVAQFIWYFGETEPDLAAARALKERESLPDRLEHWDGNWRIKGWVGTASLPKQLDSEEAGNLNSIVVFARGRLFHENILDRLNDGRLYTKYLTGQIEADFLDDDDKPDIATSDRQRVQEDDDRYRALVAFLRERMTQVEKRWLEWRKRHEVEEAKKLHPALSEWLDTLPHGFKKSAETMVAKISALPIEKEDDRKVMYRHSIIAFERLKLTGSTEELAEGLENPQAVLSLLADRDSLEASLYRDIVKSRLEAIRAFQTMTDEDSKERVLQQYLFEHLWLLDSSWERATGSEIMETRMAEEGVSMDDLTEKEKLGRVDIKYRTTAGKHVIVELKKAGRKMKLIELQAQGQNYVDKVRKILKTQGQESPDIEVVFVLGKTVDEEGVNPDRIKASMSAISTGSRIKYYDALIRGAQDSYSEFLEESKKLDKLEGIVSRL